MQAPLIRRPTFDLTSLVDIEASLKAANEGWQNTAGATATIMGGLYLILAFIMGVSVLVWDWLSTIVYSFNNSAYILPEQAQPFAAFFGLLLSLLPILTQLLAPSLIKRGVRVAWWALVASLAFDVATDFPACQQFIHSFSPLWQKSPYPYETEQFALFWWVMGATIGFEYFAIVCFSSACQLLWQGKRGRYDR